jgi:toxin ParE1/3/4
MRYSVVRAAAVARDLDALFDVLLESYVALGDSPDSAFDRAVERIRGIDAAMETLGAPPHRGTLREEILPGLRNVTIDRAIYYFIADDEAQVVRVLAVFFGGQDHQRAMLMRVMGGA